MILDMLRKGHGWFTRGVLIVLALTFVLGFGFSLSHFGVTGGVSQGTAAEVNGEKITLGEFYRFRDSLYRQIRQEQGEVPESMVNFINLTALNQLIELKLLSQKARELGFRVTDDELSEAIKSNPAFQIDGQFIGAEGYKRLVEQFFNQSVSEFERAYREELLAQKLLGFIYETAKVTDEELLNIYRMKNEKVNLYFVTFSPEDFFASFSPTEKELKDYYEKHREEFKTPEVRRIRYIVVTDKDFEDRVTVSEEELKAYYDTYTDEFRDKDSGKQKPFSEVRDEILESIKKQRANSLKSGFLSKLEEEINSESIENIAKESNAGNPNEVELFSGKAAPQDIPERVVKMAFSLKQSQRAFTKLNDSIWVIEVSEVIPSKEKGFNEAKDEIFERVKLDRAREAARLKAEEILRKIKEEGKGFKEALTSLGFRVEETGYFSRLERVPKIGIDELKLDAFYLDEKNPVASKVYSDQNRFYVVALKDKKEIDIKEFEKQKAELREKELSRLRRVIYINWINELRKEAKIVPNENLFLPYSGYGQRG